MKRIKTRYDLKSPESRRTPQNLVDNAKRIRNKDGEIKESRKS